MKIDIRYIGCRTAFILFILMYGLISGGCTDTTGSAGAVAIFDGNSRCRYCNARITDDDIDTMKVEHGNGICGPEVLRSNLWTLPLICAITAASHGFTMRMTCTA